MMEKEIKKVHLFRVPANEDAIEYLKKFASYRGIRCAWFNAIGALKNAEIGYYSVGQKRYIKEYIDDQCELLSGMGNISTVQNDIFVHFHVVLGRRDFWVKGGHLISGKVFVLEVSLQEYDGECERRGENLKLWPEESILSDTH